MKRVRARWRWRNRDYGYTVAHIINYRLTDTCPQFYLTVYSLVVNLYSNPQPVL